MAANISFIDGKAEAAVALKSSVVKSTGKRVHVRPRSQQRRDDQGRTSGGKLRCSRSMTMTAEYNCRPRKQGIRTDDYGLHLGVMSDQYRPIQNKTAFSFLDSLLKDGGIMRFESAGALRGGRTVWALARLPSVDQIAEGDALNRYVLWLNSHDATGTVYAIPTNARVVCSNTARLAIRHQNGIRHIGDMTSKLTAAHKLLSQADKAFTDFRDKAQVLAKRRYSREQANEYVDTLVPVPDTEGRASTIRERKVQAIRHVLGQRTRPASVDSWNVVVVVQLRFRSS